MKKILTVIFILACVMLLFSCKGDDFNDMVITAADVSDVPEGEYTLIYSISDYEKYLKKYPDMEVYVTAVNDKHQEVEVANNRNINIEKDRVYTVRISIYATVDDDEQAKKTQYFTVTAIKSDLTVEFKLNNNVYRRFADIKYGTNLDASLIPSVPDYKPNDDNYDREILAKKWTTDEIKPADFKRLSQDDFDQLTDVSDDEFVNITKNITIYAAYVYKVTPKTYSIVFHNNGGSETATISKPYQASVTRPASPTKTDCVFEGWYTDAELTDKFNWNDNQVMLRNAELYAKWLPATSASINDFYQFDLKEDSYGYKYYLTKPLSAMSGEVTLPTGYNNIPVKGLMDNAFLSMGITSVTIPAQYDNNNYHAFEECHDLTTVTFEANSKTYFLDPQMFFNCSSLTTIVLPGSITDIGASCFEGCSSLESIVLPNIDKITSRCFAGTALTSITVPDSVIYINEKAFINCTSLTTVNIGPNSHLTSFASDSLDNTAVTAITLPGYFRQNNLNPFEGKGITVSYHPAS